MPGDPPGLESSRPAPKKDKVEVVEKIDHALMDQVNVLPNLLKILGAVAAVGLVLLIFILPGILFKPLPKSFEDRNLAVADAVIANDTGMLRRLCKSGTGGDAASWLGQIRPPMVAVWDPTDMTSYIQPISTEGARARMTIGFLSQKTPIRPVTGNVAHAEVGFQPRGTFEVPIVWAADSSGQWWLDGAETLQILEKSTIATQMPTQKPALSEPGK